ncbi:MAG: Holliday junction branch migration DNA helicase RuvB [Alphaproteobacteria bacterium GM7ARS4]|nr:Holliday junction branch migration DNA helicase RuvB [Alphaproteobacteria bacterium GM7ARS4]
MTKLTTEVTRGAATASSRIVSRHVGEGRERLLEEQEKALRPRLFDEFIGQDAIKKNLHVFIHAAKKRHEALDHVLLCGPPGLGKTTLARLIASHAGVGFRQTSGAVLLRGGDLAALLTSLEACDVLFIDEIHRLSPSVEEILYPAMEDGQLDIMLGAGVSARSVRVDLNPFTLVGATTRSGLITRPLRERFGIPLHLQFYDSDSLERLLTRYAMRCGITLGDGTAYEIASRSRMTPRVALRLLRRVRDFSDMEGEGVISKTVAQRALASMGIDGVGLDGMDKRYLLCLADNYGGGPAGVEALAAVLSEQRDVVEDVIESFLIQKGFVQRTKRGRLLTRQGWHVLGKTSPERGDTQEAFLS